MSLLGSILNPIVTPIVSGGNNTSGGTTEGESADAPGTVSQPEQTSGGTGSSEPAATNPVQSTSTSDSIARFNTFRYQEEEDAKLIDRVLNGGESEEREDEVIAVDFARRAAIAAQARAKSESLLDGFDQDPFEPLSPFKPDTLKAYSPLEAPARLGEKMEKEA